jgi:hypothetical protein
MPPISCGHIDTRNHPRVASALRSAPPYAISHATLRSPVTSTDVTMLACATCVGLVDRSEFPDQNVKCRWFAYVVRSYPRGVLNSITGFVEVGTLQVKRLRRAAVVSMHPWGSPPDQNSNGSPSPQRHRIAGTPYLILTQAPLMAGSRPWPDSRVLWFQGCHIILPGVGIGGSRHSLPTTTTGPISI